MGARLGRGGPLIRSLVALALVSGCSGTPDCSVPTQRLAGDESTPFLCAQATPVFDYVELLAGRTLTRPQRAALAAQLARRDRASLERLVDTAHAQSALLLRAEGADAVDALGSQRWAELRGEGAFATEWAGASGESFGALLGPALVAWERDDAERLVLSEMDIEGWIRYASLCREAQGGEPLRISVASRLEIYNTVRATFRNGDRAVKLALIGVGAMFPSVRDRWADASFEEQQAWIRVAPLPPPMEASSLGYLDVLLGADPRPHADALFRGFAGLRLRPPGASL